MPVKFQTITTSSLFEFGANDNSISVAPTPVTENESTSSGTTGKLTESNKLKSYFPLPE